MSNAFNPEGKDIRFIDSHYMDLFHIPDGGTIQVQYADNSVVIKPCKFMDEYHTQIGNNVFHICQFAELMERSGSRCQPEPEVLDDEAAWKVGTDRYLALQTCADGYDYTLFDAEFQEIDGGQLDNPDLTMLEARTEILEDFGLHMRELRAVDYEDVVEKGLETEAQTHPVAFPLERASVMEKLQLAEQSALSGKLQNKLGKTHSQREME